MVIYLKHMREPVVVDFNTRAPLAATPSMFSSVAEMDNNPYTVLSSSVKTILPWAPIAGLYKALKDYGTMDWEDVVQPAIRVAEEGFVLTASEASSINSACAPGKRFQESPASMAIYCQNLPHAAGDVLKQPDLANSLRILAKEGPGALYTGTLGQKMVSYLQSIGSVISMKDMDNWQERYVTLEKPGHSHYRGYDLYTSPICTGGENVVEMLNVLNDFSLGASTSANAVHLMMETMKVAFTDRFYYVSDPWYVSVPYSGLMSQGYANTRSAVISPTIVQPSYAVGNPWPYDNNLGPEFYLLNRFWGKHNDTPHHNSSFIPGPDWKGTTSSSVFDQYGNVVAMTFTVNDFYGNGITVPGTGITMNDGFSGDKFNIVDPTSATYLVGGKLALNNMNPFLILKNGKPFISGGGAGARTIMVTAVETTVNVIDYGMDIFQALSAPRFYCANTEASCYFEPTFDPTILTQLKSLGHIGTVDGSIGEVHAIEVDPLVKGSYIVGRDIRSDASVAGGFQKK
jgi:gamma-glutamyltranspeptidase/glutathione hydrolase